MTRWDLSHAVRAAFFVALVCAGMFLSQPATAAGRVALLVGVGKYQHIKGLEGPVNDVAAMRDVLVRRWGFGPDQIVTLVDGQATRAAVMAQISALQARTKPGDEVLVYFSGHGTSASSSLERHPLPHGTGAFVPFDFNPKRNDVLAGLIVGSTDLRPAFLALETAGRRVWHITDSCFSGNQARSLFGQRPRLTPRMVPLPRPGDEIRYNADLDRTSVAALGPYPYREVVSIAASAEGEVAQDIGEQVLPSFPTLTGKPHGAFTDALLRVLDGKLPADSNKDGQLDLSELQAAVSGFMASRAYGHAPQRLPSVSQDVGNLGARVFFGRSVGQLPASPAAAAGSLRVGSFETGPTGSLGQLLAQVQTLGSASVVPRASAEVLISVENGQFVVMTSGLDVLKALPESDPGAVLRKVEQLAWTRRLWSHVEQNRRGVLPWSYDPDQRGGNFRIGCELRFAARPDREAWLLLLNADSDGRVSVLYPADSRELSSMKPGQLRTIPDASQWPIKVQEPQGIDIQIALAFDQKPSQLEGLIGLTGVAPSHPKLEALFDLVERASGRFTAARSDLRTLPPHPSGKCV